MAVRKPNENEVIGIRWPSHYRWLSRYRWLNQYRWLSTIENGSSKIASGAVEACLFLYQMLTSTPLSDRIRNS